MHVPLQNGDARQRLHRRPKFIAFSKYLGKNSASFAGRLIKDPPACQGLAQTRASWGRFDVTIRGRHPLLRVIAGAMNLRSRLTRIATGDQALFVKRSAFERVGGYPEIALMEDIALSKVLRRLSAPLCLRERAATSARRWEKHGVVKTVLLMWRLRLAYSLGADPNALALRYAAHK